MSKKKENRGRYMDSWTQEEKREIMSLRAKQRWGKMSVGDRKKFGRMLLNSRSKK